MLASKLDVVVKNLSRREKQILEPLEYHLPAKFRSSNEKLSIFDVIDTKLEMINLPLLFELEEKLHSLYDSLGSANISQEENLLKSIADARILINEMTPLLPLQVQKLSRVNTDFPTTEEILHSLGANLKSPLHAKLSVILNFTFSKIVYRGSFRNYFNLKSNHCNPR
jgi:hypothetical protein